MSPRRLAMPLGGDRGAVEILPFSATFADRALETLYRGEQLQADAEQAFRVMLAVSLALLALTAVDWHLLPGTASFWLLLFLRTLFVGLSIATGVAVRQTRDPDRVDRLVLYWAAMFVIVDLYTVSTRPPEALGHTMIHSALAILIYVAVPLPLVLQTLLGAAFATAYLYVASLGHASLKPDAWSSLAVSMVAANLLGWLTARRQQLAGRRLFAVLAHVERLRLEADRRSITDALTGLLNRRGWNERLESLEAQCRSSGRSAAIVAVDLDGLKRINDTQGHAAGDALIAGAARCLKEATRAGDAVARLGGDELAVLAADCDEPLAAALAQRVETALERAGIAASLAYAARDPVGGLEAAWKAADAGMYARKEARRNGRAVRADSAYVGGVRQGIA